MDLAKLKKLEALATPAPWEADDFRCEDGYGEYRAFHVVDPKGKALLDTSNSELQIIHDDRGEGPDGPEGSRWDETGRQDTAFIAEVRNATPKLINRIEVLEDLLDRCLTFADRYVDVVDGDYGQPEPNEAMKLVTAIREELPAA